jgi:hypothetical protein
MVLWFPEEDKAVVSIHPLDRQFTLEVPTQSLFMESTRNVRFTPESGH